MDKAFVGQRVTAKVHAAEKSIDQALTDVAALMIEMQAAQAELKMPAMLGDTASARVVEALSLLQQARTSMVAGHKRLDKIREAVGIRTKAMGIDYKGVATRIDEEESVAEPIRAAI